MQVKGPVGRQLGWRVPPLRWVNQAETAGEVNSQVVSRAATWSVTIL